ncbi:sugar transferase [Gorillibacterium timonense]|uniref:sugar transferase n=1 Tax=Gorillibacterium timonense TaxID=1689269 RepID=UPI00071C42E7|nr:sugar transferase [Gorillibacterium timonense]
MGIGEYSKNLTAQLGQAEVGVPARERMYLMLKRTMDVMGGMLGILLALPVLVLIALLIKLEDPQGGVFFRQTRVGKNGKEFQMFKFRSMVSDAEKRLADLLKQNEIQGNMFKMKNDPRITRVGRVIRKMSLDELPQLWNVVKGDMSLVGPRPPLPREVKDYTVYHRQRLQVTPGCTGLWQVSGRNSLSFEQMVELDLTYIRKRSIWMDLSLIARTVKEIFASKSAF